MYTQTLTNVDIEFSQQHSFAPVIVTSGEMSTPVTSHSRMPASLRNGTSAPVPHPASTTRATPFPPVGRHASAMRLRDVNCCREMRIVFVVHKEAERRTIRVRNPAAWCTI